MVAAPDEKRAGMAPGHHVRPKGGLEGQSQAGTTAMVCRGIEGHMQEKNERRSASASRCYTASMALG
jgi:hypothetical protein